MSENEKLEESNISFEDINNRLLKIESHISQDKKREPLYRSVAGFVKKVVTKENIEFAFSLIALIISISVAVIILK